MYSKPKDDLNAADGEIPRQSRSSGGSTSAGMTYTPVTGQGGAGRRSPADWSQGQSFYWRGVYNHPVKEPEHDEAFVEESGIKVYESSHEEDDEDENGNVEEEEEEEDPLYQLDVLDDTIVEEGEDDDDDEEDEDSEEVQTAREIKPAPETSSQVVCKQDASSSSVSSQQDLNSDILKKVASPVSVVSSSPPPASSLPQPQAKWTVAKQSSPTEETRTSNARSIISTSTRIACFGGGQQIGITSVANSESSKAIPPVPPAAFSHIPFVSQTSQGVPQTVTGITTTAMGNPCVSASLNPLSPVVVSPPLHTPVLATFSSPTSNNSTQGDRRAGSGGGSNSRPSSRPTSRSSSPLAVGLTGNMWAGLTAAEASTANNTKPGQTSFFSQAFQMNSGRGRAGRLNLPLTRINAPRHKFTIRRVVEQESPAKRAAGYVETKTQEANRGNKIASSPIWLRKLPDVTMSNAPGSKNPFQQSDATTGNEVPQTGTGGPVSGNQVQQLPDKSKQPDDGDPFSASQSSYRPRSGTWSMANSRRNKLKQEREEEAKQRQRRKSGDDLTTLLASGAANGTAAPAGGFATRRDPTAQHAGFFDSFRPRSKSDAKAIMQSRQRRKSGDDVLNASAKEKEKEKKKDASPGFLDSFRPRSKSDAARGKKPNIISTVKNAVQHSLVSPNATTKSGRRSGDATPVETAAVDQDVYHTWHAGAGPKTTIGRVWDLFRSHRNETTEERQRRKSGGKHEKGQLVRRHSMEPERKRNGGSTFGHTYLRGEDPNQAAIIFRDCRGLPATAPFLENVKRSELEEDESQILVKFFKYHTSYDLIPTSAKLVIFDTRLQVKKAFYALVYNGVRAAPLWDAVRQEFVGMLTITDFIRILQSFYNSPNRKMEELEEHRLEMWRTLLNDDVRKLISITPNECLYEAIRSLIHHKIHRLPVIDPTTGNVLYIITHKRILKFLFLYINELPKPSIMLKSLRELKIGTYENIETARGDTLIIEALNKFVERRISALPIVDDEGKLIDIYAKFDVINLAAEGTYHNLDVTLHQANEYRNEWFEGVLKCTLDETMEMVMERIVRAEVHRLVVVDNNNKVIGIISLSDILNELVLKPCDDDPASIFRKTVAQMESALNGDQEDEEVTPRAEDTSNLDRLKTESEESVSKSWEGSDTDNVEKKEEGPSSSAESIDDANKFAIDVSKISETMGQHEIGPISG